jgi:hypothetical protein
MVLLRNYLYPKFKPTVIEAVAAREPFDPFAILPRSYGPFSRPVGGPQAVAQCRARLLALRAEAARTEGAPDLRRFLIPQAVYHGPTAGPVPGLQIHDVPFRHYPGLRPPVAARRRELATEWWRYTNPATMRVASQAMPEVLKARYTATQLILPQGYRRR